MLKQRQGQRAERAAEGLLREAGLRLIERNFSCKMGEIDLIMRDRSAHQGPILVFVEVRYRASGRFGGAAASITPVKQRRIVNSARRFLQRYRRYASWPCRFDVVAVTGSNDRLELNWVRGAFDC
mgnify:CR=1 FL=1